MALAGYRAFADVTFAASAIDEAPLFGVIYMSDLPAGWHTAMSNAGDTDGRTIRVTKSDGTTECAVYPVGVNTSTDTGCIFFRATDMSISVDTTYRVYVGNASSQMYATTDTYGRNAVFSGYAGAYLPGMTLEDLTGAGRTLTARGTPGTAASGYEGITAATFNGSNNGYYYDGTQGVTAWPVSMEAIVYSTSSSTVQNPFCLANSANSQNTALMPFRGDLASPTTDPNEAAFRGSSTTLSSALSSSGYTTSTNYYIAISRSGGTGTGVIYRDGVSLGSDSTTINSTFSPNRLSIGHRRYSASDATLNGRVTVALLSDSVRSADYVSTMQDIWAGTAYTVGSDDEVEGTTGWVPFGTAATTSASGSLQDWSNPSNALTINSDAATAVLDETTWVESETLKLTNPAYGITIPSGQGSYTCKFRVTRYRTSGGSLEINDLNVQFIDNTGALAGTNLADGTTNWPTAAADKDYTVFGVTLTDAKFDADSGLAFSATGVDTNGNTTAYVTYAVMMVEWTAPSGNTGTGDLTAPAGTTSGTGTQTLDGTGSVTAPAATVSGSGITGRTGTGAITAPAATTSGTGVTGRTGTGAVTAPAGVVSGAGTQTVDGTGALTAAPGEVDGTGTGTGSTPVTGTGALEAPMPLISGDGEIQSGNQDLVGALTAPAGVINATATTGKTGTAGIVAEAPVISGVGKSIVYGTGALTAPSGYTVSGTGLNSPPAKIGTGGLTAPDGVINGTGYVLGSTDLSVEYLQWYTTGASDVGRTQRDEAASLGGNRSSTEARSMTWECRDPMVGVEILAVSALNGRGFGSLNAVTENSLSWTPPGGTEGDAVTLASGDEAMLTGFGSNAWIRVRRISTIPMSGAHAVQCLDIYNNVIGMGNVASADAVSGKTEYRAIMGRNPFAGPAINVKIWLDADANDHFAIGYEAAVGGAIQTIASPTTAPTGITWVTGTTSATGITIPSVNAGGDFGLWMRRTIPADSAPSPSELNHIHVEFEDLATNTRNDDHRGKYRIARSSYVTYGLWVGQDEAPDLNAAPDETFTSRPHTTTLSLASDHTYYCVVRQRNKWGLWSQNTEPMKLVADAAGEQGYVAPAAPTNVIITQTADDEAIVSARYEPVVDTVLANATTNDPGRAEIFVLWMTTDDSAPDVTDPPTAYALMGRRAGVEIFKYTDTGNDLLDGTPIKAIVRSRRLAIGPGDDFSPDTTQLPASGSGTIVVASELADWDSSGYLKVTTFSGALQEVVAYSNLVVGSGISTFTVLSGGRAQFGTTAAATATNTVIYPIYPIDSDNTDVATGTIDGIAPGRPWGELFFGSKDAQQQEPIEGPDGVTEQYIDAPDNIYLLLGEGWTELWMDTALVWKVFQDGGNYDGNTLYIPSEWEIVTAAVSGAATGVFDAADADNLYIVSGGVRRVHIDASAMTITVPSLSTDGNLPEVAPQSASWEQYAGSLLQSWDPARSDYRPYIQVSTTGVLTSEWPINNNLTQAEIVAL